MEEVAIDVCTFLISRCGHDGIILSLRFLDFLLLAIYSCFQVLLVAIECVEVLGRLASQWTSRNPCSSGYHACLLSSLLLIGSSFGHAWIILLLVERRGDLSVNCWGASIGGRRFCRWVCITRSILLSILPLHLLTCSSLSFTGIICILPSQNIVPLRDCSWSQVCVVLDISLRSIDNISFLEGAVLCNQVVISLNLCLILIVSLCFIVCVYCAICSYFNPVCIRWSRHGIWALRSCAWRLDIA